MPMITLDQEKDSEQTLPFEKVANLAVKPPGEKWMVRSLWGRSAVGFLYGAPKCSKSWLGLEIATSVASGTPCLGVFPVDDPGPVLVYLAEDALDNVRARVAGLCVRRNLPIQALDLHVVTAPALRLDLPADQKRLRRTLEKLRPRLLVLDPLVRMHALNENDAAEISQLLGYLRELQRTYDLAILVIHHARKRGASHAGQTLRGSSDFYAWTDSSACLTREADQRLVLDVEHRSARSPAPIHLELHSLKDGSQTYLRVLDGVPSTSPSQSPSLPIGRRILEILESHGAPRTNRELRELLQVQNTRLSQTLADLETQGLIKRKGKDGWLLVPHADSSDRQPRLPAFETGGR